MYSLTQRFAGVMTGLGLLFGSFCVSSAAPLTFSDQASFHASLAGFSKKTLDFESLPSGSLIPSGSTVNGITFTYALGGESLKVTDAFVTPASHPAVGNSLGLTGGDEALLGGDGFTMTFADPVLALGLWVITSPDEILPGDFTLSIVSGSVSNVSGTPAMTVADGGKAFFLGLIEPAGFNTSTLTTSGPFFLYNVDDITSANPVPEPGTLLLLVTGLAGVGVWQRRRVRTALGQPQAEGSLPYMG